MPDKIYTLKGDDERNEHGQMRHRQFNAERLAKRSMDELLGICKGLVADHVVNDEETAYLIGWTNTHRPLMSQWPGTVLGARIEKILADRIVTPEEREDLFVLLKEVVGVGTVEGKIENFTSTLPITRPAPPIFFTDQKFCFTGRFFYGTRADCEHAVLSRSGYVQPNVTLETNYLVLGTFASTDWLHSTHGLKIQKALDYQQRGQPLALISEQHWTDHLL